MSIVLVLSIINVCERNHVYYIKFFMDYGILCICRRYRQQVKDFLHTLVQSKPLLEKDANESCLTLEVWDDKVDSKDEEVLANTGNESASNNSEQYNYTNDFLFTIDKLPNKKQDLDIPTYGQVISFFFYTSISYLIFLLSLYIYLQLLIYLTSIEKYLANILLYLTLV